MQTRRAPTEEQKARAAERRAQFRILWKQVADMDEGERIRLASRAGIRSCEDGHEMSPTNQCLIMLQNPDATVVGGFRQWIRHGRKVRKGEHGISIWIPRFPGKGKEGQDEGDGDSKGAEVRFFSGTVFDVAQTSAIEDTSTADTGAEAVGLPLAAVA